MQNFHAKENFLKYMKLNKADLTRKKLIEQKNSSFISNPHLGDMEIEDGETDDLVIEVSKAVEVSCVEEEQKKSKEEGELSEDSNECSNAEKSSLPPSDNSSLSKVDKTLEKSLDSESISKSEEEITLKRKIDSEVSDDSSSSSSITVKRQHKSSSKGFTLGVCIPESVTPFQKLPESTKWSVDVSDHILFDNLPDSTGTWQKMKDIVKGVQNEMQKLNSVKNS
ncbi:Zinc finger CCHC domain-containing protein 8-like protein [Armadillidium vulgare]|nr:Zinc finger CCHC domain-containing protein 8-like protein [Armadillidium vulgare]